jgi:hypothetical protein
MPASKDTSHPSSPLAASPPEPTSQPSGYEWSSRSTWLGKPVIHVAFGSGSDGRTRTARGIIAIGQRAVGVCAFGLVATGFLAVGPIAFGIFSVGIVSAALGAALGVNAIAPVAYGICAIGIKAGGLASIVLRLGSVLPL